MVHRISSVVILSEIMLFYLFAYPFVAQAVVEIFQAFHHIHKFPFGALLSQRLIN